MVYEYGIGIDLNEPLGTIDDAMAEEIGERALDEHCCTVYLLRGRLGNAVHVASFMQPHMCRVSTNAGQRQWRQQSSVSCPVIGVVGRRTSCHQSAPIVPHDTLTLGHDFSYNVQRPLHTVDNST